MGKKMRNQRNQKNHRSDNTWGRRDWKSMDDRTTNSIRGNCARWSIVRGMYVGIEIKKIPDRCSKGNYRVCNLRARINVCGDLSQAIGEERAAGANRNLPADRAFPAGYRD